VRNVGVERRVNRILTCTDDSRELVSKARAGDHGQFLITAAEDSTKLTGIDIKKQNLGTNPVRSQKPTLKLSRIPDWQSFNGDARYCSHTL
jgi:hypothetical protein